MFNSVEYVRNLCQQRRIPVSTLERDCGFSNGYLNPKKLTRLPYDRAVIIAEYLGIQAEEILTGEKETAPRSPNAVCLTRLSSSLSSAAMARSPTPCSTR